MRVCSNVPDFNKWNQFLTAKWLKQDFRYHEFCKAFSKVYRRHSELTIEYNIGLKNWNIGAGILWWFSLSSQKNCCKNSKWLWSGNTTITKLQTTNPWHREKELHNNHEKPGRQTKQSNQLSLPHQDDCKTRRDIQKCTTKHRPITESHNGRNNKQQVNNNRTIALEWTAT